jgi:hypothetical protein
MSFFLFLLINATLFIRPAEVVPALLGLKIYEALTVACLVAGASEIFAYFSRRPLTEQPVTLCVFGLMAMVPLSHLSHMNLEKAGEGGFEFFKVLVYYVLLVSIVNTPTRLRRFLYWTAGCCTAMTLLALLRYHEVIDLHVPPPPPTAAKAGQKAKAKDEPESFVVETVWDPNQRVMVEIRRLQGTGIFKDPNDLCLAVVIAVSLWLYGLNDPRIGVGKVLMVPALLILGVVLYSTHSRGGLLGMCTALMVLFHARFGWRRSLLIGLLLLPVLVVVFAGRMTNLETSTGTGQTRIQLWSDWLEAFRTSPLFGVGVNNTEEVGISHVAHNAYLQAYADLGILGGALFVGAWYFALLSLHRAGSAPSVSDEMRRLQPYLLALLAGSAVCMLTLSLTYLIPTYMLLGLATVYVGVAVAPAPRPLLRCDLGFVQRLAVVGIAGLAVIYLFMRVFRA